jgi:polyhydroxybutyrate depolymerase
MAARRAADGLPRLSMASDGQERTFLVSAAPGQPRPTIIALHGGGGQAPGMVGLTDLVRRGSQAGFTTVFPDGLHRAWNDGRTGTRVARRADVDDARFLVELIDRLARSGVTDPRSVFLCGMSNGAFMCDHLARVAPDRVAGIGLVAGTARVGAPTNSPAPPAPMPVMMFSGDADPLIPYGGGAVASPAPGARRRATRRSGRAGQVGGGVGGARGGRGVCMGAESLAADWARIAGCDPRPMVERLAQPSGDLGVVRLTWMGPAGVPIVLHRIEGGGHTWPGGPQYLPPRLIGRVATGLDATGILLGYFEWILARRGPRAITPPVDA